MRDVFIQQLLNRAQEDERIILLTGDLGFRVFDQYRSELPNQFLNVGVAEQNMSGIAAGLAHEGHIVFTYSIGNFVSLRCLEQIRNDVCYPKLNVNIVCIGGGLSYGNLGASHHTTEDIAILRALPEMKVVCPGDANETVQLTDQLIDTPGPAYLRLERGVAGSPTEAIENASSLGSARVLRNGRDITLISTGGISHEVFIAAEKLHSVKGIDCRVLSMHTIDPVDHKAIISAAQETGGIVTVEEHRSPGGLRGVVAEVLFDAGLQPKKSLSLNLKLDFCRTIGSQEYLRKIHGLSTENIFDSVCQLLSR